jgi:hypothetical protein
MGNLIWHEYSRLLSVTACVYTIWASFWGLIYRKFFWDFVDSTVRDPGGLQPGPTSAFFVTLILKAPVIQITSMFLGLAILALDFPLPMLKGTRIHRSLVLRVVLLLFMSFFAILFYQGTNGAIWSFIAAVGYARAITLGESMEEAKDNRGTKGRA